MSSWRAFLFRLQPLFSRKKIEAELSDELRVHLEMAMEANIAAGLTPEEARRAAQRELGGVEQIKEAYRDQRGVTWVAHLTQDLRFGARMLARNRGFAGIAIASLALGIGTNLLVFSLVNAVVFRPLPGVTQAERIVHLSNSAVAYSEFDYYREHARAMAGVAATTIVQSSVSLALPGAPRKAASAVEFIPIINLVSGNYFSALGVSMELGRRFTPEEDRAPGKHPVLILSHWYWVARFQSDPQIVGKSLLLNEVTFTVVGVAGAEFLLEPGLLSGPRAWAPMAMAGVLDPAQGRLDSPERLVHFFGRLAPGATQAQAQAEFEILDAQYAKEFLPAEKHHITGLLDSGFTVTPWRAPEVKALVTGLLLLGSIVLLVACANLANLLLARGTTRQREISVRLALGASRGRIARQLLTESLMMACAGGALGLLVAALGGKSLWPSLLGLNLTASLLALFSLDIRMAVYAVAVSLATGVAFGLVPALEASKSSIHAGLKREQSVAGFRMSRGRLRSFLVIGQIAVSVAFLIIASLVTRVVLRQTDASLPFETGHVFWIECSAPSGSNATQHPREFQRALIERLRALPGVQSACLADVWYGRDIDPRSVLVDDRPLRARIGINESRVSPDYFATLGVPVVDGRNFTADDVNSGAPVFVVSETFAQKLWPGEDPLGRRLRLGPKAADGKVIGVVKDGVRAIRTRWNREEFAGDLYSPLAPAGTNFAEIWVRTAMDAATVIGVVPARAQELDKGVLVQPRGPLSGFLEEWRRLMLTLSGVGATLGGLALLLAAIGVYCIMAFAVVQRTHEIGVRLAMGAPRAAILRLVLGEGIRMVACGVAIGAVGCAVLASLLRAFLYGLSPIDPVTFGGISLIFGAVALLACWFPARRATKVDPIVALRCE